MLRSQWQKDVDWHQMQKDGLTPYREMTRWRRRAISGWSLAILLALALAVALQMVAVLR